MTMSTSLFNNNYLEDLPCDLQMKIVDMSKTKWFLNTHYLDHDKFNTYMKVMVRKDMEAEDKVKHDSINNLFSKLAFSNTTYHFANQKVLEAIDEVVKYQDLFNFDLRELFSNLKLNEKDLEYEFPKMYDWNKDEYIDNPEYRPNSELEYSDEEDTSDDESE